MNTKLFILCAVAGLATASRADVLLNTFGPSGTGYHPIAGWAVNSTQFMGKSFTIASAYTFSGIDLPLRMAGESDQFMVSLRGDSAGSPGSVIESFTVTNAFGSNVAGAYSLTSSTNALLTAGTYHVTIEGIGDATGRWMLNTGGITGPLWTSPDSGSTWNSFSDTNGALRVHGAAVPEPATMAALGLGAAALLRRRRK